MTIKLLFTDMEGTLYAKQAVQLRPGEPHHHHSLWSRLVNELGPQAVSEDALTISKWEAGEYTSYLEWCEETLRLLSRHGLERPLFERVLDDIPLNEGVARTFAALRTRGVKTAIVSGGFIEQARRAQQALAITHAYAAADLYWSATGRLEHWNLFPSDYEGKVDFVRLMIREYGLSADECAFVGDGQNDVYIAREVGLSFAYQGHPELKLAATHQIEDFAELLELI
jgi:phosphoserine phosphatase